MFSSIVSFVGSSGSGKTTLIEKIVKTLSFKGYRIGCIKHDAHRFEIDKPGKDSFRFKEAGAEIVSISSSEKIALIKSHLDKEMDILEIIIKYFSDVDFVITEGYKRSTLPKIEILRKENGNEPVMFDSPYLIGVVSNHPKNYIIEKLSYYNNDNFLRKYNENIFDLNDTEKIVSMLEEMIQKVNVNIDISSNDRILNEIINNMLQSLKFLDIKNLKLEIKS
ncbi:MAG: molybdopterin-guanine dinucleotide biosynthesis protein B [Deferribacterales bacterium]